jgi:hypothetical protein
MSQLGTRLLFWSPRILAIAFAIFLSIFALDVFDEVHGFWLTVLALLIHLMPVGVFVAILIAAWRWEWIGAAGFTVLAALYVGFVLPRHLHWAVVLGIPVPLLVIAGLFLADWILQLRRPRLRTKR